MRDNWKVKEINDLVSSYIDFRGKTPLKLGMKWGDGDIRALSANNVEMGKVNFEKECYFASDELYRKWMTKGDCEQGDILLTMEAPLGNVAQIPDSKKYILSQRTILLKVKEHEVEKDFFFHLLSSEWFQKKLVKHSTGSTVTGIQQKKLGRLEVSYPPLPQQRKIAHILSTCDAVIEQTEAAIAKYEALKQGMMHDLFTRGIDLATGQLRPTYADAPELYKESELGWIPREWEVDVFEKLCLKVTDRDHFTPTYFEKGIPIISPKDFDENHNISFKKCKYISREAHLRNCKKTDLTTGDLVFTRIGAGLGKVAIVESWMPEFSILHSACMIRANNKLLDSGYLKYFMKGEILQKQIGVEVQSIGVPDLGLDKIRLFKCSYPTDKIEQILIANKISAIDQKIQTEQSTLAKYQQLKAGLMQDLLTGKVEVEVDSAIETMKN